MADELETAKNKGAATGRLREGRLDHCPYYEPEHAILRAIWTNAFVTARLYGDA